MKLKYGEVSLYYGTGPRFVNGTVFFGVLVFWCVHNAHEIKAAACTAGVHCPPRA